MRKCVVEWVRVPRKHRGGLAGPGAKVNVDVTTVCLLPSKWSLCSQEWLGRFQLCIKLVWRVQSSSRCRWQGTSRVVKREGEAVSCQESCDGCVVVTQCVVSEVARAVSSPQGNSVAVPVAGIVCVGTCLACPGTWHVQVVVAMPTSWVRREALAVRCDAVRRGTAC